MSAHVREAMLALYAGNDLSFWKRLRVAGHLRRCEVCSRQVEEFRAIRESLEAEPDVMPVGVRWDGLAAEMRANIRLGLAAGQCVAEPERVPVRMPWRTPAVALPVLLVVLAGWILQTIPPPIKLTPAAGSAEAASSVVLEGGSGGIGIEQNGRGFSLLQPQAAQNVMFSVRGDSVRSRYVDSETGQVTISHVYAD